MNIDDFIQELQNLKPSLRKLPVVIIAPNGLKFKPKAKILREEYETMFDDPKEMVITHE